MPEIITDETLAKINKFTHRELSADEVYVFPVILCDNEIDRDNEAFSIEALQKLAKLYIGKTGIFDHNPKGSNQTARIFDTEVITDLARNTKSGEAYTYLKATAYMVKTSANQDLIKEIDAGIKKEVSVSCSVEKHICSICGTNNKVKNCSHKKGRLYNGRKCYIILDNPTDAYEWSFVAVPAQVNAGVTKHYSDNPDDDVVSKSDYDTLKSKLSEVEAENDIFRDFLKRDIVKLSFLCYPEASMETLLRIAEGMSTQELVEMKNKLEKTSQSILNPQTFISESTQKNNNQQFKL